VSRTVDLSISVRARQYIVAGFFYCLSLSAGRRRSSGGWSPIDTRDSGLNRVLGDADGNMGSAVGWGR